MIEVYQIQGTLGVGGGIRPETPAAFTITVLRDELERVYGSTNVCGKLPDAICNPPVVYGEPGYCHCASRRTEQAEQFVRDLFQHENLRIDVEIRRVEHGRMEEPCATTLTGR